MKLFRFIFLLLILFSCSSNNEIVTKKSEPGLFSKDASKGISIGDFLNKDGQSEKFYVNSFLWRASLDVLSFAPFQSTDAFGGIIVTEWFKKNNQQIKYNKNEISEDQVLGRKIEDLILTKARVLRIQNKFN